MPELPLVFPPAAGDGSTAFVLTGDAGALPVVGWLGAVPRGGLPAGFATDVAAAQGARDGMPLLVEHSRPSYRRPGLRGHRRGGGDAAWSTAFVPSGIEVDDARLVITADDAHAGLALRTEAAALPGGALRIRHIVTNTAAGEYLLEGLDVCVPAPVAASELLDFTGRHERERTPQRHPIADGLWLRESRRGRTGLEAATMIVAGAAGFGFDAGEVVGVHVAASGNSVHWAERDPAGPTALGGGELLLPGEVVLATGESYATPWVFVVAAPDGLDAMAAALHTWQRSLPAHPVSRPVTLNVWEAVYFDHDLDRVTALAERAAQVGVERFVLDDGWFHGRRDDTAGLGDWWVDADVWPRGLQPLIERVHALGMEFGLWFEPEMINPDSDTYRAHPDWALGAGDRVPHLERHQLVLDLTRDDVFAFLLDRMDALLTEYDVAFVKWDHNRDLLEPGSGPTRAPAVHRQAAAHYALLDELRRRHPDVAWESCASGGGRIDLGVLERVQRVWTSDMTDALSRQQIQRWTTQLLAPEYLGAHVSAPTSHQTGRTIPLDFRAGTALFGSFGIEWDLTTATPDELAAMADWVARYRTHRELLHSGRVARIDSGDPAVLLHGVVAADRASALVAHVQLDESASNRGVVLRIPGLRRDARYRLDWVAPVDGGKVSRAAALDPAGPTAGASVTGAVLADVGVWLPRRRPETILLIHVQTDSVD